jgi:hypothetical protein
MLGQTFVSEEVTLHLATFNFWALLMMIVKGVETSW